MPLFIHFSQIFACVFQPTLDLPGVPYKTAYRISNGDPITMATLRCRPSESEKEAGMVFMSATQMLSLKLKNGDLCSITWKDQSDTAVAWLTSKADLKDGVIGVSRWLQDRCGIKLENKVTVEKSQSVLPDDAGIPIEPVSGELQDSDLPGWAFVAKNTVVGTYRYLVHGQRFFVVSGRLKQEFEVSRGSEHGIYRVTESSQFGIGGPKNVNGIASQSGPTFSDIGGLRRQKGLLMRLIDEVLHPEDIEDHYEVTHNARGVILWGPSQTGKTLLRKAVQTFGSWTKSYEWNPTMKALPKPSGGAELVHVRFFSKPSEQEAKTLLKFIESGSRSTLVIAEIQDPNDLPYFLRNEDAFADEIEVTIPDVAARLEILDLITRRFFDSALLQRAAAKTHGYVGGDLRKLTREIRRQARLESEDTIISDRHLDLALTKIRPSALQQVFLEKPNIKWSDIGGQEDLKARLRNAVEWPLHYSKELRECGVPRKKGILLYGPPGCSKTLLVKALATESDYNFLAVKGAELISMYVGESERATREVFRKARAASPCIIFFDEIDSIARRASGSSELNVLTTLLNEMDGFEELKDVFVVAATNKPQVIDPALIRPGRFDNVVYVGPPDPETRRAIFIEKFKNIRAEAECKSVPDIFVNMTEGFSGADVVSVCGRAGEIMFERAIQEKFGTPPELRYADVIAAIESTPRTITSAMIEEYNEWNSQRVV